MSAQLKNPQVLITGSSSIGAKLASVLLSQNCGVTVIDNCQPQEVSGVFSETINLPGFEFIKADIVDQLPDSLKTVTHIYQVGRLEEPSGEAKFGHRDLLVNSAGTENLLKLAQVRGVKFILVSTLDVYAGAISQTSLESYFGANSAGFSHLTHHEAKRFAESLTAVYFHNFGVDCSIARVAQVYGPKMNLDSNEVIPQLINQAITGQSLKISGNDLDILHPTFIDDVVWGLVKIGFAKETKGAIYNLVTADEVTVLEFISRLKEAFSEINPHSSLEISFDKEPDKSLKFSIPKVELAKTEHDLGWKPKVGLKEGLARTLEYFSKSEQKIEKAEIPERTAVETLQIQQPVELPATRPQLAVTKTSFSFPAAIPRIFPRTSRVVLVLIIIVILLLLFPIGQILAGVALSLRDFGQAQKALTSSNLDKAKKEIKKTQSDAGMISSGFVKLKPLFLVTGQRKLFDNLNQNFVGINVAVSGLGYLVDAGGIAKNLGREIISGDKENFQADFSQLNLNLSQAVSDLETARIDFSDFPLGRTPVIGKKFQKLRADLAQNLPNLKKGAEFAKILPDLTAVGSQKSYLVLFQNNGELRPGGGFIGSYAVFNFENGKLAEPVVDDIYNLDGQLKVEIPPPAPLKTHLGVAKLGVRDSNWHYDFSQDGQLAANLYQQITGKKVDGVIGVDVDTFSALIKALGPIKLPDYGEEITAQNLAERAEYYSEINFFPGSASKKDFLGSLARQLIAKLKSGDGVNYLEVAKVFAEAADEKHLNFYFTDPATFAFFASNGWSGQIAPISVQADNQIKITSDYLALSEANVGANKANRFVEKTIKLTPIILRDGDLITNLEVNFANKSPAPTWPGGNYKNYLRIITPVGSVLEQFKIGDSDVTAVVEQTTEADKQIFAVFFEVPAGEARKITLNYRPNYRIEVSGNRATYSLLVQKQPGTGADAVNIDLAYPGYLKVSKTNILANLSEQKVSSTQSLSKDLNFQVEFSL